MNKYAKILLSIVIFNILFFSLLFFPKTKLIITPEFSGGDNSLVYYPYQKASCDHVLKGQIPFWSKDISQGYPLLGEGEVGAFNPINITSCLLARGDYKLAFNINILLNNIFGQFGMVLLAEKLGLSLLSGLFLGITFTLSPILLMNYLHISMVYPLLYVSYIMTFLINFLNNRNFKDYILMTIFISLQFLVCHYQMFFISYVFISVYLLAYSYFEKKTKKEMFSWILLFNFSYLLALLLTAFQVLPGLELVFNSDRLSAINPMRNQNLALKNLLTIINPYILGFPKNGTYDFSGIHPWESNVSIYSLPFLFLLFALFKIKKLIKNSLFKALLVVVLVTLLFSFGDNSPLYFIHSLPVFSSFHFPSRFLLVVVFGLALLASYGFDLFIKKQKKNYLLLLLLFLILVAEATNFYYSFHVFKNADQVNIEPEFLKIIKKDNHPIYSLTSNSYLLNKRYIKEGYLKNPDWYYDQVNSLINGNNNYVYGISAFKNKSGVQLKRNSRLYSLINESLPDGKSEIELSKLFYQILEFSGVRYLISVYPMNDEGKSSLVSQVEISGQKKYLYELKNSLDIINYYNRYISIYNQYDFQQYSASQDFSKVVMLENYSNNGLSRKEEVNSKYQLLSDTDHYLKILSNTDRNSILYLPRNWYPSWKAYVNGKETKIYKANLAYMAIDLPNGKNTVEFKFVSESFIIGAIISLITIIIIFIYKASSGMRSRFFKR